MPLIPFSFLIPNPLTLTLVLDVSAALIATRTSTSRPFLPFFLLPSFWHIHSLCLALQCRKWNGMEKRFTLFVTNWHMDQVPEVIDPFCGHLNHILSSILLTWGHLPHLLILFIRHSHTDSHFFFLSSVSCVSLLPMCMCIVCLAAGINEARDMKVQKERGGCLLSFEGGRGEIWAVIKKTRDT